MARDRSAREWYELGYTRRGENDLDGAREAFERAIGSTADPLTGPARAGALRALGELADIRDEIADAVRLYRQALELDPKIGVMKRLRALERLRDHPDARKRLTSPHV
jgi:tetratricopeptide (TPR) repeat protein